MSHTHTVDFGSLRSNHLPASASPARLPACRSFEEGLFDAARIIYTRIPNYGRLASTLVRLHQFQAAVDAARKASKHAPVCCLPACPLSMAAILSPLLPQPVHLHPSSMTHK